MAQTVDFLSRAMADNAAGRADTLAVLYKRAQVGYAGIWQQDEIGFMFLRTIWGAGIAHEALTAVIIRARTGGHDRFTADVAPDNTRSLKLLDRLGFTVSGTKKHTWCINGK